MANFRVILFVLFHGQVEVAVGRLLCVPDPTAVVAIHGSTGNHGYNVVARDTHWN